MTIAASSLPANCPLLCAITLLIVVICLAQPHSDGSDKAIHIPSSGGEVLIATVAEKAAAYDQYHDSPARRVGDTLCISGRSRPKGAGKTEGMALKKSTISVMELANQWCLPSFQ